MGKLSDAIKTMSPEMVEKLSPQERKALGYEAEPAPAPKKEKPNPYLPSLLCLSDVEPEEVQFLWQPYIPLGKLTLLEGDPGLGKTFLALNICAALTQGWPLLGTDGKPGEPLSPGNILFMSAEDGPADTLAPRLEKMGADRSKIFLLTGWRSAEDDEEKNFTLQDVEVLRSALNKVKPSLVVIDPLQGYIGGIDFHRANETRPILSALGKLAEEFSCAVLAIRHLSKGNGKALYRGLGSVDFTAAARSVILVGQNPDDGKKAIVHIKSSCAENGPSIGFTIDDLNGFTWTGLSDATAESLLAIPMPEEKSGGNTALEDACDFLQEVLHGCPVKVKDIQAEAKAAGISWRTVERAKGMLGFKAFKDGSEWFWPMLSSGDSSPPHSDVGGDGGLPSGPTELGNTARPPRPPIEKSDGLPNPWFEVGRELTQAEIKGRDL